MDHIHKLWAPFAPSNPAGKQWRELDQADYWTVNCGQHGTHPWMERGAFERETQPRQNFRVKAQSRTHWWRGEECCYAGSTDSQSVGHDNRSLCFTVNGYGRSALSANSVHNSRN